LEPLAAAVLWLKQQQYIQLCKTCRNQAASAAAPVVEVQSNNLFDLHKLPALPSRVQDKAAPQY
jgi:hypothetical protein